MNNVLNPDLVQMARMLYKKGHSDDEVLLHLKEKGAAESHLHDVVSHLKSIRMAKKRNNGFLCCGIGIFLLVIGCFFTLLLFNNGGNIRLVMYGVTSIGIAFTLKGMIDLLGW